MNQMRILHVWDQAGVACILAKYQCLRGDESEVLIYKNVDKFGIYDFYREYCRVAEPGNLKNECISLADSFDIIHIHSLPELVLEIKRRFPRKKIFIHFHGTDLRGWRGNGTASDMKKITLKQRLYNRNTLDSRIYKIKKRLILLVSGYLFSATKEAQKRANAVIVSTPDLVRLANDANYLPNPVDVEHFKPKASFRKEKMNALTIIHEKIQLSRIIELLETNKMEIKFDIHDRNERPVRYAEMPDFLRMYKCYLDLRFIDDILLDNLSFTALQSLACGLKVLDHTLTVRDHLASEHYPHNVIDHLYRIYRNC